MKNPHAVALGRLGRFKGGPSRGRARAPALSASRRTAIARAAASARSGHLPELLRPLFPGYELEQLRLPDHVDLVMLHVLTRGGPEHKRWLVRRFDDSGIRRWIVQNRGRGLTIQQTLPWVSKRTVRRWQAQSPYALLWEKR